MKKVIRNYFLDQKVNLNNKSSFVSSELSLEVEKIRDQIKQCFSWTGEIIFLPNPYYAKKLILENFSEYSFFSNYSDNYLFSNYKHSILDPQLEVRNLDKSLLFWEGDFLLDLREKFEFFCVEKFSSLKSLVQADFFLFTPIQGITILGFKVNLEPFFLGSSSVLSLSREGYKLDKSIKRFDCGTGNYALLLSLSKYFEKEFKIFVSA